MCERALLTQCRRHTPCAESPHTECAAYIGRPASRRPWKAIVLLILLSTTLAAEERDKLRRLDPAAWGDDHVGKPLPAYVTGDECLFCHRETGATWGDNRHQLTMRPANSEEPAIVKLRTRDGGKEIAADTEYVLGAKRLTRFLQRSQAYGKLDLLSAAFVRESGELKHGESPTWNTKMFAERCAGCHTTAVNSQTRAFSAVSLDCFVCHGDVSLEHTKDKRRVLLSNTNREPREAVSICGQCHLRGGRSKSSQLPYPNTFVAGDNLFRDFQVDFSDAAVEALPPIDQHIYLNARDVALFDQRATTCLTCHEVHRQSSGKHQQLADAAICSSCHVPGTSNNELRDEVKPSTKLRSHSRVCDY